MPGDSDRITLALHAAEKYYLRDHTMEAIADSLHMSRSSVSRLLSFARDSGLVDIRIRQPSDAVSRLQHRIRSHDDVTAYVVPVPSDASVRERREQVVRHAGRIVSAMIGSSSILGVAWGATIAGVSLHLTGRPLQDVTVVQVNGAAYPADRGTGYVGDILGRFAQAFGARIEPLAVPAIFDDPATRAALWGESSIDRIIALQDCADIALFGVGSDGPGVPDLIYRDGYLSEQDRLELEEQGVVGDVATVFLRADGTHSDIALNRRTSGPDLTTLRGVPRRICVVDDPSRITVLRATLAAGLITDLILDEASAEALAASYRDA